MIYTLITLLILGIIASLYDRYKYRNSNHKPYGIYEAYIKRFLDFEISLLVLIIFSPIYLILAILVKSKLGSPILFKQDRPGQEEKIFKLYKFRSMREDTDKDGNLLSDEERLTSFGKKLRSTSLDELPEMFNILKGEMALIGPRPLLVEYLPYYKEDERHRHDVKPGLSGLAQVNGRNLLTWEEKFKYDLDYVNKITFLKDLNIIFNTIKKVFIKQEGIALNHEGNLKEIRSK